MTVASDTSTESSRFCQREHATWWWYPRRCIAPPSTRTRREDFIFVTAKSPRSNGNPLCIIRLVAFLESTLNQKSVESNKLPKSGIKKASSEAAYKKERYGIPRRDPEEKGEPIRDRAGRLGCSFWSAKAHSHATSVTGLTWKHTLYVWPHPKPVLEVTVEVNRTSSTSPARPLSSLSFLAMFHDCGFTTAEISWD